MKKILESTIILALFFSLFYFSNNNKSISFEKDKATILQMCGCHKVTFNYTETFVFAEDSLYTASPKMKESIYEWIDLTEDLGNKLVLQHILQTSPDSNAFVIKHWRQDWEYEDINLFNYDVDNRWLKLNLKKHEVNGKWSQKVFQIDDMPRYSGIGNWVYTDDLTYWQNITDAPLARRETKVRSDYNVLNRGNKVAITDYGWLHEQDNKKIKRTKLGDEIIAMEKGYNTYQKVEDVNCQMAINWWEKNTEKWKYVRDNWNTRLLNSEALSVDLENNSISLYKRISDLNVDSINTNVIDGIINSYVIK